MWSNTSIFQTQQRRNGLKSSRTQAIMLLLCIRLAQCDMSSILLTRVDLQFLLGFYPQQVDIPSDRVDLYLFKKPLTGKFYARHDFPDPGLIDPDLEQAILKKKMLLSKDKFKEPLTGNMEYGWYVEPRVARSRFVFNFPRRSTWITQIGAMIAMEDQNMPKKPFAGIAFKV